MGSRHFWMDGTDAYLAACDAAQADQELAEQRAVIKQDIIASIDPTPSESDRIAAIEDQVLNYAGCAREVYGGWVWVIDGNEQRWSKRPTHAQCIEVVYEVVERLGQEAAFSEDC